MHGRTLVPSAGTLTSAAGMSFDAAGRGWEASMTGSAAYPGSQAQRADMRYTREMSIEDMLLENRVVFLAGPITPASASLTIMRLLYLQSVQKERDINLYINSPGGYVDQTLAIYDTMQFLTCPVATYCIGMAASGAAVILMAGARGKRFMLPHSKMMLHQPHGGIGGQAEDIRLQAEEILKEKEQLLDIMAAHSTIGRELLREQTERDRYISPQEAKSWGLIDEVVVDMGKKKGMPPTSGGQPLSGPPTPPPSGGPSAGPQTASA